MSPGVLRIASTAGPFGRERVSSSASIPEARERGKLMRRGMRPEPVAVDCPLSTVNS